MSLRRLQSFFTDAQTLSVGFGFAAMGALFATWSTSLPFIKEKFQINDDQLGLILLFSPLGNIFINMFMANIIGHFGAKRTTVFGGFLLALLYMLPTQMPTVWMLAATLFLIGTSISLLNVAVNTCVSFIESATGSVIMASCHGMFSLGLMVGSFMASIAYAKGIAPNHYSIGFSLCIIGIFVLTRPYILAIPREEVRSKIRHRFKLPSGLLIFLIIIAICNNFVEGTMASWTTIYLKEVAFAKEIFWGVGLTSYSFCMATGRFFGDWVIPRFGSKRVMVYGGLLAFTGLASAIIIPEPVICIIGFGLVGFGVSCMAPILYAAAMRVPGLPEGAGLATMNTFSIGGFLLVPVLIGMISAMANLQIAFGFILVLVCIWVVMARFGTLR